VDTSFFGAPETGQKVVGMDDVGISLIQLNALSYIGIAGELCVLAVTAGGYWEGDEYEIFIESCPAECTGGDGDPGFVLNWLRSIAACG